MSQRKKFTLSKPQPRTDLIAAFRSMKFADPVAPAVPASTDTDSATDSTVTDAIAKLKADFEAAQAAQAKDPDGSTDPNDVKVADLLTQLGTLLDDLDKAQAADVAKEPAGDKPADSTDDSDPAKPAIAPDPSDVNAAKLAAAQALMTVVKFALPEAATPPPANPVDEVGNIDPTAECITEGCGHLASAHEDLPEGENSGACSMQNCSCESFLYDAMGTGTNTDPEGDDADGSGDVPEGGGPDNSDGGDAKTSKNAGTFDGIVPVLPAPADAAPATTPDDTEISPLAPPDSNPAPFVPGSLLVGAAFTIPVGVIEGQQTGDGRGIALNALTWGTMPMPLMGLATSTHDPMGYDLNDPSIICGRIDSIERTPGENDTNLIVAKGFFLANDDGQYFADLVEQMGRVGVSADISVIEQEETISGMDDYGWPLFESTLLQGNIDGFTIVPFPAFSGAYIVIGDGTDVPEIPQQVADVMKDAVPAIVAAGGQLIHYMAAEECLPCAQGFDVLTAAGGPMKPPADWFENPNFTLGDGRLQEIFTGRGEKRVGGSYAVPFTVTDEGEVFGHIAPWGVCHAGEASACITAPHSKAGYAHFMRAGQQVITAEGKAVNVGVLTLDTGHASTRTGVNAANAQSHYDNTGAAFADVVVGEDEFGIWVHGALRPDVDELRLRKIRASSPSGDWREINGNLELVACLAVNQPGFPVASISNGREVALVAAGAYQMAEIGTQGDESCDEGDYKDHALRRALTPVLNRENARLRKEMLELQKEDARRAFAKLREEVKL